MFKGPLSNSFNHRPCSVKDFPGGSDRKESACNVGDLGSIPELGRYSGERHGWKRKGKSDSLMENALGCLERAAKQRVRTTGDYQRFG